VAAARPWINIPELKPEEIALLRHVGAEALEQVTGGLPGIDDLELDGAIPAQRAFGRQPAEPDFPAHRIAYRAIVHLSAIGGREGPALALLVDRQLELPEAKDPTEGETAKRGGIRN
jgi:hypothetical protein